MKINDFPKLQSPFVRNESTNWKVIDEITPGYEWVFEDDTVMAIEKLDGCLHYSQMILTDKGSIKVGEIVNKRLPVKVASYNFNKKIVEYKEIEHYHKKKKGHEMISIQVIGRVTGRTKKFIVCTTNHKFWSDGKWIEAKNLKPDQTIHHITDIIPEEIKQIILGSLLGDGCVGGNKKFSSRSFAFSHSVKQKGYFDYKKKMLGNLFNQHKSRMGGYAGTEILTGDSIQCPSISDFICDNCLINDKKTITKKWVNAMSPFAIAIWYMDDGSCNFPSTQRARAVFHCNSYSDVEVNILSKKLLSYGVINKVSKYNKKGKYYPQLDITSDGTERLFDLIFPYIPKSMKYKLHPRYKDFKCVYENKTFKATTGMVDTKVIKIDKQLPKKCSGGGNNHKGGVKE